MFLQLPPMPPLHVTFAESMAANADWWVAGATIALAIATVVLAIYTYKLFRAAKEARQDSLNAVAAAQANAEAAQRSGAIADETMRRTLRPYVVVKEITTPETQSGLVPIHFEIVITNTGQTPAVQVQLAYNFALSPAPPEAFTYPNPVNIGILAGRNSQSVPIAVKTSMPEGSSFLHNNLTLYIYGYIQYRDMLSENVNLTNFMYGCNAARRIPFATVQMNTIT